MAIMLSVPRGIIGSTRDERCTYSIILVKYLILCKKKITLELLLTEAISMFYEILHC